MSEVNTNNVTVAQADRIADWMGEHFECGSNDGYPYAECIVCREVFDGDATIGHLGAHLASHEAEEGAKDE